LFICCLIIGVMLNPFIIWYHSRQKRSFATYLFLAISSIDQIKSLYIPIILIPKLLSPQNDIDYYYDQVLSSVSWTSYSNGTVMMLSSIEGSLLILLCIARYMTLKHPLTSAKIRNRVFSVIILVMFLWKVCRIFPEYLYEPLGYMRVVDTVVSMDPHYINKFLFILYIENAVDCLLLMIGGLFSGLTVLHLKNSDTAASNTSARNIRRGIVAIVAMNFFNVLVLLLVVVFSILIHAMSANNWHDFHYSTTSDFIQFTQVYGAPLIQSSFNSVSLLCISSSFRMSVGNAIQMIRLNTRNREDRRVQTAL
jgi:hypothetical protein